MAEHEMDCYHDIARRAQSAFSLNPQEAGLVGTILDTLPARDKHDPSLVHQRIFNSLIDRSTYPLYRAMSAESWKAVMQARQVLEDSGLLITLNHSHKHDTFAGLLTAVYLLDPDMAASRAVLVSQQLANKSSHALLPFLTRAGLSFAHTQAIPVFMQKYGWSNEERRAKNLPVKLETLARLCTPGNMVSLYPEGSIQPALREAKRGLREFISAGYGHTLPVMTNIIRWMREPNNPSLSPVSFSAPVRNSDLITHARSIDAEKAPQIASDYVMMRIAQILPEDQQGFYQPFVSGKTDTYADDVHVRILMAQELSRRYSLHTQG